jgi:hypothetical protein
MPFFLLWKEDKYIYQLYEFYVDILTRSDLKTSKIVLNGQQKDYCHRVF